MPGMFSNLFRKGVFIMKDLKGSKTEANLLAAFAGESQARNKYTYYASKARKDGYVQIAEIFEETANNEKEHAKIWFKILKGGEIPDTATNLQDGVDGENYEWTDMYAGFAKTAKEEGLDYAIDVYPHYGSDVEATLRAGYDIRHGLVGPGVYASHNYERSHMDGVKNTLLLLKKYIQK